MTFEAETFMKKITLNPLESINQPHVFLYGTKHSYWLGYALRTGLKPPVQTYLKHWIDNVPWDMQ